MARRNSGRKPPPRRPPGRTPDSIATLEPLLADRQKTLGPEHPETLLTRNNLANAYRGAGRTQDAIAILELLLADLECRRRRTHRRAR